MIRRSCEDDLRSGAVWHIRQVVAGIGSRRQFTRVLFLIATVTLPVGAEVDTSEYPKLVDRRLRIQLYAADPDIVTPIGAAVDAIGRLYVVESHTHSPPSDYDGPQGDRIKVFSGTRADGYADQVSVFADDLFQAQSLGFDDRGTLFVVCTRAVFALHDRDDDGRAESRTRILTIEPYDKRANPHGQLQGIACSADGWLYVGRGAHVGGDYTWRGTDGTQLTGGYDGGDIVRVRPDGTGLERVATGFWNPYALAFDRQGRLLAVDNDPDARGPNRLLHIVSGGDYGYKLLFGRFGLHPYQAWEGDLPGTLPMIYGVGEAPTGVVDANTARLPADYQDSILVSVWGEHNLSLYRTKPRGSSMTATREIFLQGEGSDNLVSPFRPSGLAVGPDGEIYVTDWMLIDYTTHRRGRIWKITAREGTDTIVPRPAIAQPEPGPSVRRLNDLYGLSSPTDYELLRAALNDDDPFIRAAAVNQLAQPLFQDDVVKDLENPNGRIRLGALLAIRRADLPEPESLIRPRLDDSDLQVLQLAMIWTGEKVLKSLRNDVEQVASNPHLDKRLFETWLATMQILDHPGLEELYANRVDPHRISRDLSPEFIESLVHDHRRPPRLRALAMRWLLDVDKPRNRALLTEHAVDGESLLQLEAIRRLATSANPMVSTTLEEIAMDSRQNVEARTEALVALSSQPTVSLLPLLDDHHAAVRLEAVRTLRTLIAEPTVRAALDAKLATIGGDTTQARLVSQLQYLLGTERQARPGSVAEWQTLLADGGDIEAGRRVFFSANTACNECHVAEGRGGVLGTGFSSMPFGPDLSRIARTANRQQLIESIVAPSNSIAPEMQGWFVMTHTGQVLTGRQIDQEANSIQLIMTDGREHDIPRNEIETWGPMKLSLMPEDLPASMAIEEFRDLLAYLESLK